MNKTQKLITGIVGGIGVAFISWLLLTENPMFEFDDEINYFLAIMLTGVFEYFFWKSPKEENTD